EAAAPGPLPSEHPALDEGRRSNQALDYLRDLHREVLTAPREDDGAPPENVDGGQVTMPIALLASDSVTNVYRITPGGEEDPSFTEGDLQTFPDGSSLARHAVTTGGTELAFQQTGRVADAVVDSLDVHPRDEADFRAALLRKLQEFPEDFVSAIPEPHALEDSTEPGAVGSGVALNYRGADGVWRMAVIRARNAGDYSRYQDAYDIKVERRQRFGLKESDSHQLTSNRRFTLPISMWPGMGQTGTVTLRLSGSYNQVSFGISRTRGGLRIERVKGPADSHLYVNDAVFDVKSYVQGEDHGGLLPAGDSPHVLRLGVRNGFHWRVPTSMTRKVPPGPLGLPREIRVPERVRPEQVTVDAFAPPAGLIDWALGVAHKYAGLTLDKEGARQILEAFQSSALRRSATSATLDEIRTPAIDVGGGAVGYFSYRVHYDHEATAALDRPFYEEVIRIDGELSDAAALERAVNKNASIALSGGWVANLTALRASVTAEAGLNTARNDNTTRSSSSTIVTSRMDSASGSGPRELPRPHGSYRVPVKLRVAFHSPDDITGFGPPPHLRRRGIDEAEQHVTFDANTMMRITNGDAREWGGWDTGRTHQRDRGVPDPQLPSLGGDNPFAALESSRFRGFERLSGPLRLP
ncbi:hypothetical protein ADK38_36090, partial [Streptomyces varsoviensis]